ncbi:hypothetical protein WN943_023346 [Citrus x changshan-huyou]
MSPRSSYMCFVLAAVLKLDRTSFCWRQINDNDLNHMVDSKTGPRVHTYCFMDEMFLAVSKSREIAQAFKSYIKRETWDAGTVRIGNKWLAHGLKKWYNFLLKVWMQDVKAKAAESEELIVSEYIAEPALPQELRESFYEFQKHVEDQIIDWFSGVVRHWCAWYRECDNFSEIKQLISNELRIWCIRTLAAKYRIREKEIGNRFDSEPSRIPSSGR